MQLLTKPLTVEDWLGNIYLLIPSELMLPNDAVSNEALSSSIFKAPFLNEKKTKLIKRVMVGADIDRDSISMLLRTLRRELNMEINLENVSIFRLCSGTNRKKESIRIDEEEYRREVEIDMSSYDTSNEVRIICDDLCKCTDTTTLSPGRLATENFDYEYNLDTNMNSSIKAQGDLSCKLNNIRKFTFFTCWCINDNMVENYFLLPNDNVDAFIKTSFDSGRGMKKINKISLEESLKMIEKVTECRIKLKPIVQSRRVTQLLYRKVVIYSKHKNAISNTLHLLNTQLSKMIRNAVFYQPLPETTDDIDQSLFSKFNSQSDRLNYAHQHNLKESPKIEHYKPKGSKIPIFRDQKRSRKILVSSSETSEKLDDLSTCGKDVDDLFDLKLNDCETSEASVTIRGPLLI